MKPTRCGILALTCLLAAGLGLAQGDPDPLHEAISRELSVFIGAEPEIAYREAISREISVFIGAEPEVLPYREAISRELTVFIGAEPEPPYREVISREVSVFHPNAVDWWVTDGQRLDLSLMTRYDAPTEANTTTVLRAVGAGSVVSMPNVTNVVGNPRPNGFLKIEALNGGRVELPSALTMTQPFDGDSPSAARGIQVLADGTNSVVDLSALEGFEDLAVSPGSRFEVRNGGTILLGRVVFRGKPSLLLSGSGVFESPEIDLQGGTVLRGGGVVRGRLVNDARVTLAGPAEPLVVEGEYLQTPAGVLEVQLLKATAPANHLQMVVTNAASFAGTLQLVRATGFAVVGQPTFPLIQYHQHAGTFDGYSPSLDAGGGNQLTPSFLAAGLELQVSLPGPLFGINATLGPDDRRFDGEPIVVLGGATLTVEGRHAFRSVRLRSAAKLTCPPLRPGTPGTPATGGRIELTVEGDILIDSGCSITADAKGFPARQGPGAPRSILDTTWGVGAGHGGFGGNSRTGSLGGEPYDSLITPNEPGSGGSDLTRNSAGGGVVVLKAGGLVQVEGNLSADALVANGSGSGGSIRIEARTLAGTGLVSASGGDTASVRHGAGGGAGGRISIMTATGLELDPVRIQVRGGLSDVSFFNGDEGTVYYEIDGRESVEAEELFLGGLPYEGRLPAPGQRYFKLNTPAGETVRLTLEHADTNAWTELYVRFDRPPTLSVADFVFTGTGKSKQVITIPTSGAGTYYLFARTTHSMSVNDGITLGAVSLPFGLESVEPSRVGPGPVRLLMKGARWTTETAFSLSTKEKQFTLFPQAVRVIDATTASATFEFEGLEPGSLDLVAVGPDLASAALESALVLEPRLYASSREHLETPPAIRRGRASTTTLVLENTGNVDLGPLLAVVHVVDDPAVTMAIPASPLVESMRDGTTQSIG